MQKWLILCGLFLAVWGGHWMPWRVAPFLVDERKELRRPLAYAYGCLCILVGFALWAALNGPTLEARAAVLFLSQTMIAAGLGALLPRAIRRELELQALRGDRGDYEQAIERRREAA